MPVFIMVTTRDSKRIWLNAGGIVSMERLEDDNGVPYTEIRTLNDDIFAATEDPGEITRQTKNAIANFSGYWR